MLALPALASAFIENTVVFASSGIFRRLVAGDATARSRDVSSASNALVGALSGVLSSFAICPAEVRRCDAQFAWGLKGDRPLSWRRLAYEEWLPSPSTSRIHC